METLYGKTIHEPVSDWNDEQKKEYRYLQRWKIILKHYCNQGMLIKDAIDKADEEA